MFPTVYEIPFHYPHPVTGKLLDMDLGDAPKIYRLRNGRKVVGAGQKDGRYHVVDAKTGEKRLFATGLRNPNGLGVGPGPDGPRLVGPCAGGRHLDCQGDEPHDGERARCDIFCAEPAKNDDVGGEQCASRELGNDQRPGELEQLPELVAPGMRRRWRIGTGAQCRRVFVHFR